MAVTDRFTSAVAAILRHVLPSGIANDVIGDLVEHSRGRRQWRRLWLVRESIALAVKLRFSDLTSSWRPASPGVSFDLWIRDLRYALRSLFRSRGFATVAIGSLAIGIGLTTAVFSAVDGVMLRPVPYGDADEIVRIRELTRGRRPDTDAVPRSLLRLWEANTHTVAAFAPYATQDTKIDAGKESFVGVSVEVGARFFDVLRATPSRGRTLTRLDSAADAPDVAVLSHAFWLSAFGGNANVVGRSIVVGDRSVAVVGVLPETFVYPASDVAVYLPGRWTLPEIQPGVGRAFFGPPLEVLARLHRSSSPADAAREATALSEQLSKPQKPAAPARFEVIQLQEDLAGNARPALVALFASVGCVLAIVCVNLASLILARGTARRREMMVRAALGASAWRMARPLVLESVLLALFGGSAGLAAAGLLISMVPLTAAIDPMLASRIAIDGRVLAFAFGLSSVIGIVAGVLPAWQAPSAKPTATRAEGVRTALVVVQVGLAMALTVGATLLSRSLVSLVNVDLGFHPEDALSVQVRLPSANGAAFDWRAQFYVELLERLAANPDVRAAGFTTSLPMRETFSQSALQIDGVSADAATTLRAHREVVSVGYFKAIGLNVTDGRAFSAIDTRVSEPVVVVNDAFRAAFFAGARPIDRRVFAFGDWRRVVGVVASKRHAGLRSAPRPEFYLPLAQSPPDMVQQSSAGIVVRTRQRPEALLPFVRASVRGLQPLAALDNEIVLDDAVWASTAQPRFYAMIMGVFATLALTTALVGLYGVLAYLVERRRAEIGVRRALGATAHDIAGLVILRGLKLVAIATPFGLLASAGTAGLLRSLLFGVQPLDAPTFVAVTILVPLAALAASVWPARSAVRIAPLDALREESRF